MTVSGWGLLNDGGNAAKKLQEVDLEVKNTWSNLMQIMWYHHAQIIWMKECREDFHYKKNWITSKMMCTFKWVTPQTLHHLHSLEKKKFFFLCAGKTLMPVKATVEAPWWGSTPQVADMNRFHWPPQFNSSLQIVHCIGPHQLFNRSPQIVQLVPS